MQRLGTSIILHPLPCCQWHIAFSRRIKRRKKASEEDSSSEVDPDGDGEDSEDPIEEDTELPSSPPAKTDDPDEGMHSDDVRTKDTKLGRGAPRKAKVREAIYLERAAYE
jgi:hypothetical protein